MDEVSDIIAPNLTILFIGFNPGLRSAQTGHHFAGHSNRFWRLLAESGLTPRRLQPNEDHELLTFGYGITNIVDRPSQSAAQISKAEYRAGRETLKDKLALYRPRIACYAGIGVYREFALASEVTPGLQASASVVGIADFVLPSPSGLNRTPFEEQLILYLQLQKLTEKVNKGR